MSRYDYQLDGIAVERIMAGTLRMPKHAQSPERIAAIRQLAAAGMNDRAIADRVGMTWRAVTKTRHRHNVPAGKPRSRAVTA